MVVSVRREVDAEVRGCGGASVCGEERVPTERSGAHWATCMMLLTSQLAHKRLARAVRMHRLRRARNALPGECADSKQRPVLLRVLLRPSRLGKDGTHADNVRPVTGQLT